MIKGIGTDIVEVGRMERECRRHGDGFLARIFCSAEVDYCEGKRRRFESYAARFAAKEAFLKALGADGGEGISWLDIEVVLDEGGRPGLALHGRAHEVARERGVAGVFVSLSHSGDIATAVAVLEGNDE